MRKVLLVALLAVAACSKKKSDDHAAKADPKPTQTKAPARPRVDIAKLAAVTAPGFTLTVVNQGDQDLSLTAIGDVDGKKSSALISAGSCDVQPCQPLDEATWKANDNLKGWMSSAIAHDPHTIFEVALKDVAGKKAITVYTLGFVKDASGSASEHGYAVYWNDGARMATLMIGDREMPSAESFDDFKAKVDRAHLEQAGDALLGALVAAM